MTKTRLKLVAPLMMLSALMLSACSNAGEPEAPGTPSPSPTEQSQAVDQDKLGAALDQMIYQGASASKDGGRCLIEAAKKSGLNDATLAQIIELGSTDWGVTADQVRKKQGDEQADKLIGEKMHNLVNACADVNVGNEGVSPEAVKEELEKAAKEAEAAEKAKQEADAKSSAKPKEPVTEPKYKIDPDASVITVDVLEPGLVSMLSSFGDAGTVELMESSGQCLANAVLESGFSEEALRFLAGGAPLGTGSVVDHLPTKADKELWESPQMLSKFSECIH